MPTRVADQKVGPHIRFNDRLWVNPYGQMTPREGSWDRLNLADKQGNPLNTKIEVHWSKPGELYAPIGRGRRMTYKYDDLGLYVPPATDKDIVVLMRGYPEAAKQAKRVAAALKDKGYGAAEARGFISDLAEDVNFHSLARLVSGESPDITPRYSEVAHILDYGIEPTAIFGMALAKMFGDTATVQKIKDHLVAELTSWKRSELAGKYHMHTASLRSRAIRLAASLPKGSPVRKALLGVLVGR